MVAGGHDPAVVHHDDLVGHVDGGEAVRDEDGYGAVGLTEPAGRLPVAGEDGRFGRGVQAGGGLVQDDDQRCLAHKPPGQGQLLPLAAGERPPADVGPEDGR